MKRLLLYLLCLCDVLEILSFPVPYWLSRFFPSLNLKNIGHIHKIDILSFTSMICFLPTIVLCVWNIVIWNTNDKKKSDYFC